MRISILKIIFKQPLYLLVAVDGILGTGLFYWWLLSRTTTLVAFYSMYRGTPLYFWPYAILTFLSAIFFGLVLAVVAYSWRRFKSRNAKEQGGIAFGTLFGALGAACPVCGSFLLSVIGIAGGVAILPFKGLEFKFLSVAFLGTALFLSLKKLSESEFAVCETCETKPEEPAESVGESSVLSYQTLFAVFFLIFLFALPLWNQERLAASAEAKDGTILANKIKSAQNDETGGALYKDTVAKALPLQGFRTRIVFGDAIAKLVKNGVIDIEKFKRIYASRGVSEDNLAILSEPSYEPIRIDADNAGLLINLLWPLGLANKTDFNEKSPINGESLFNFASTGGWTLGKEDNGGAYFNKFEIVPLAPEQEAIALEVAQNTYRPCCNNSTFFQDCNHGSAMLGLIELGASQGLSKEELYKIALQFNSFWFPQNYTETALYYKLAKNVDWDDVSPKEIMSFDYSSGSGWKKNIARPFNEILAENPGLLPLRQGGAGCGV